jgi:hypothetical protein
MRAVQQPLGAEHQPPVRLRNKRDMRGIMTVRASKALFVRCMAESEVQSLRLSGPEEVLDNQVH